MQCQEAYEPTHRVRSCVDCIRGLLNPAHYDKVDGQAHLELVTRPHAALQHSPRFLQKAGTPNGPKCDVGVPGHHILVFQKESGGEIRIMAGRQFKHRGIGVALAIR